MNRLIIGTRSSALALAQTHWVKEQLHKHYPEMDIQIKKYVTTGDKIQNGSLANLGGKGLFTKEIESGLLNREIDIAVHSMKDLPMYLPDGLGIGAVPVRESPWDVLVVHEGLEKIKELENMGTINGLKESAVIGTSSLRRRSQLLQHRPDLHIQMLRGNLPTRLSKMHTGSYDAIILAEAGMKRLGLINEPYLRLSPEIMLPAIGQGALAIECRQDDNRIADILGSINDEATHRSILAERSFLRSLGGNCNFPVAAFARIDNNQLSITGKIMNYDGTRIKTAHLSGHPENSEELGISLANQIKDNEGLSILNEIKNEVRDDIR